MEKETLESMKEMTDLIIQESDARTQGYYQVLDEQVQDLKKRVEDEKTLSLLILLITLLEFILNIATSIRF